VKAALPRFRLKPFGPRDFLRWLLVLLLGVMALGVAITFVVVALGKLGLVLMPTFEMKLFIATTAAWSLVLWAITAGGLGGAAVLLARRSKTALWAWAAGFGGAVLSQALEVSAARAAGAEVDTSGALTLFILGLMGWGVFVLTWHRPPVLPRR
jgi:hypothetical protein